ncbi:UNVERIFIED_CONTAM: hypothetical protein Sradi_3185000 [Sesamum radiatum]|uniref:Arabidopsis retrotransposon Orf1 C-terminal domain-containing protein n=1 Tax=Sesamum radiatum TaxID=300843 RepID=A0AAW2REN7_SESRA
MQPLIFNQPNPAPQAPPQAPNSGMSLEDMVKSLAVTTQEAKVGLQETRTGLSHLGNQISQLATSFNQLAAQVSGKLPSQTEANPKENVSAMTLRSGKELQPTESIPTKTKGEEEIHDDTTSHTDKKVEINIPLLDAIKTNPKICQILEGVMHQQEEVERQGKNHLRIELEHSTRHQCDNQLADHSYVRPMGLVEDVLVKVNDLLFPVDFYILKMGTEGLDNSASVLLGRPFMKTAKTKIDVDEDLIMDLDDDDECVEFISEVLAPSQSFGTNHTTSQTNSLQSILQAPILKLKALPNHLQSLYLGVRETSSASIFKGLLKEQDELKLHEGEVWRSGKRKQKAAAPPNRRCNAPGRHPPLPLDAVLSRRVRCDAISASAPMNTANHHRRCSDHCCCCRSPLHDATRPKGGRRPTTPPAVASSSPRRTYHRADADVTTTAAPVPESSRTEILRDTYRKRACFNASTGIPPTAERDLDGCLTFTSREHKQRYSVIKTRPHNPGKFFHPQSLIELGIHEKVDALLFNMPWREFVHIRRPVFVELIREFYTTFVFTKPDPFTLTAPNTIRFRLLGREFHMSINDFNLALGLVHDEYLGSQAYRESLIDYGTFEPVSVWKEVASDSWVYHPSRSKGLHLREFEWVYMHRFLAFNFSGRRATVGTCSKVELFFIWSMIHRVHVNLGAWLVSQFHAVATSSKNVCLGHLITHLAVNLGILNLTRHDLHLACEEEPLDVACLHRMHVFDRRQTPSGVGSVDLDPNERPSRRTRPLQPDAHVATVERLTRLERSVDWLHRKLDVVLTKLGGSTSIPPPPDV